MRVSRTDVLMVEDESEEQAVDLPSRSKGRSLRTGFSHPGGSPETSKNQVGTSKTRKRKTASSEDDPSFSDVEEEDEHQKKVPGYRCSPHLIPELMKDLSAKQKGWVKNIEFDSLQDMIESRMPKSLTMWLVDRVETETGTLTVCGIPVDIREAVVRILKLPHGDIKVPPPLNGRSKAKRRKGDSSHPDHKHSAKGRGQTAKDATRDLLKENEDEEEFCRSFVMLVLCIYLAPTTSLNINRNYYPALMDVSKIKHMDWCGFIADYLIQGIEEYRNNKASHVQVPGCVHILDLIYIDALIRFNALVLPEALTLPDGVPRIQFIGTEHLSYVASVDVKSRTKDQIEYGLLQESIADAVRQQAAPYVVWEKSENIAEESGAVLTPSLIGQMAENLASELIENLAEEVKESRKKIIQEFQKKMEVSDSQILTKYQRIFVNRFAALGKKRPIGDSCKTTATPFLSQGPQNCAGLQNISELGQCQSSLAEPLSEAVPDGGNNIDDNVKQSAAEDSIKASTLKDCPRETESTPAEENESGMPPSSTSSEMTETFVAPVVIQQQGNNIRDAKRRDSQVDIDSPVDELQEVVKLGVQAADQALCNTQLDEDPKSYQQADSTFSNAAHMDVPAMYDNSPGAASAPSAALGPTCADNIESDLTDLSPNSIKATPRCFVPDSATAIRGPALFDPSPATAMNLSNAPASSLFENCIDGDSSYNEVKGDDLDAPSSPQAPPSLSQLLTQIGKTNGFDVPDSEDESDTDQEDETESLQEDESQAVDEPRHGICSALDDADWNEDSTFASSPSYTNSSQEVIDIPDDPIKPPPSDISHISQLRTELKSGFSFRFGGSVTKAIFKWYTKFKEVENIDPLIADVVNFKFVLTKDAEATYRTHISQSSARISTRLRHTYNKNRLRTKVLIKGFHITEGEFVDALKGNGEVCQTLMGLCSVAIMLDWDCKNKFILDQAMIKELLKDGPKCDHMAVAAKLKKLSLEEIQHFYLPVLNNKHWILAVVNIAKEVVEIYDSLLAVGEGQHPHKELWDNLAGNLREAYCLVRKKSIMIDFFDVKYPTNRIQTTIHDCGYHVIQTLECHNTEDLVEHSKKLTMLPYRKYLCHTLIYHRFNDLNPLRPQLRAKLP